MFWFVWLWFLSLRYSMNSRCLGSYILSYLNTWSYICMKCTQCLVFHRFGVTVTQKYRKSHPLTVSTLVVDRCWLWVCFPVWTLTLTDCRGWLQHAFDMHCPCNQSTDWCKGKCSEKNQQYLSPKVAAVRTPRPCTGLHLHHCRSGHGWWVFSWMEIEKPAFPRKGAKQL